MRVVVVGAGPVGLFCGMALARRGHEVVLIDRDAGPLSDGEWDRRGVMQFRHPHFFRHVVRLTLQETLPDVWEQVLAAGGVPARFDGTPEELTGLQCRRSTFERAMREAASGEPGLTMRVGLVDQLVAEHGRITGVTVDGVPVEADVVICACGRGGKLGDDLRAPGEEQSCGFSYVARMYSAAPGAPWPDAPLAGSLYDGYQAILFPQDARTLSALIVRPTDAAEFGTLRDNHVFDAAMPLIPQLAPWTDPAAGFQPITDAMTGGRLTNGYRGQLDVNGKVPVAGVYYVGDAVSTTNPAAGRGTSLGLLQATTLVEMLGGDSDARDVSERFDRWCTHNVEPWYRDHVEWDAAILRRFAGEGLDVDGPITSDVICATAELDPSMMPVVGPYLGMMTLPASLAAVEDKARAVLRTGWRPPYADGPSRAELAERVLQPSG